ncbi:MAG TPA: discoidin domain-containing protein [Candidatus Competibacteraceae bacterium]|nr:discoidin domain-containing protein [Candidatus Competibacteraceae bacterium]
MSDFFLRLVVAGAVVMLATMRLGSAAEASLQVTIDLRGGPVSAFVPSAALGAGVDGHSRGDAAAIYRSTTLRAMRSVGLLPLSYRLRTELGIEAWHWNPRGRWSDQRRAQGYWTSDDRLGTPILASFGYRLPRRGNTIDQAENDGYSRLADGDPNSFWKSNPYLDRRYTGEDNDRHPQWLIADLGQPQPVNALRIRWGNPYAVRYTVQYWEGEDPRDPDEYPKGRWQDFPAGAVSEGRGGDPLLRLGAEPVPVRFLRVLLEQGSGTAPPGAQDPRDALGYAVREIAIGILDSDDQLRDVVRHAPDRDRQTRFFVSSTDPWHRASDLDPHVEQPGIDRVFASGLTRGLPMLMSVGALYDTPDNAAALLRYLRRRGYPTPRIEIGEEPDGQYAAPEDYGALYLQVADALRAVDLTVVVGGASLQSFQAANGSAMMAWSGTAVAPDQSWLHRLLNYWRERGRLADLGFLSFEWYPFDEVCAPAVDALLQGPALLSEAVAHLYAQGLPRGTPLIITEYGYSAFSAQEEVDLPGALFNADVVGTFLGLGGQAAYLYGLEPTPLYRESTHCDNWGNNTLFLSDDQRRILARTATYHGTTLLNRHWLGNPDQAHQVYPARVEGGQPDQVWPLTAYALYRPDGRWALLLVNKDPLRAWSVAPRFAGSAEVVAPLRGPADLYQFSAVQYRWQAAGERGRPLRSLPPRHSMLSGDAPLQIDLPPWSLTVVQGEGPQPSPPPDTAH